MKNAREGFGGSRLERSLDVERGYRRALEAMKKGAVRMGDFVSKFGKDVVSRDIAYLRDRYSDFRKADAALPPEVLEFQRLSKVLEAIIYEVGELGEWLGPDARTTAASPLADVTNTVDLF